MPSIHDVARIAGVSSSTVSRVFSGRGKVAAETVAHVRKVAEEIGYVPRKYTRRGADTEPGSVCVLSSGFHDLFNNAFYSQIVAGVEEALSQAGYRLVFKILKGDPAEDRAAVDAIVPATAGTVLIGYEVETALIERVKSYGVPFVLVDNDCWELNIDCVVNDNVTGARRMVSHLIELGHRLIGFVGGPYSHVSLDERYNGYKQALKQAGIVKVGRHIKFCAPTFRVDDGYRAAREMLESGAPPTAIFAANDALAIGVMKAAQELGFRVPGDISVAGFDDEELAQHVAPPLSTVRVHKREMGLEAGKRLLELIRGEVTNPLKIVLSTELVLRASTAPPAGRVAGGREAAAALEAK